MEEERKINIDGTEYKDSDLTEEQVKISNLLRNVGVKKNNCETSVQSLLLDIEALDLVANKYIAMLKESLTKDEEEKKE